MKTEKEKVDISTWYTQAERVGRRLNKLSILKCYAPVLYDRTINGDYLINTWITFLNKYDIGDYLDLIPGSYDIDEDGSVSRKPISEYIPTQDDKIQKTKITITKYQLPDGHTDKCGVLTEFAPDLLKSYNELLVTDNDLPIVKIWRKFLDRFELIGIPDPVAKKYYTPVNL
jgi:hypothetical protein